MTLPRLGRNLTEKAFSDMKKNAEKMRFERTGLIPKNVEEYSRLKAWYQNLSEKEKGEKMQQNVNDLVEAGKQKRGLVLLFDGKVVGHGNIGVLGVQTIWTRNWTATDAHPRAPWPSAQEFREEGDERYTSSYGRFLPIPRVPGNPTVAFKHKSWNTVETLDKVMPVPKLYSAVNVNQNGLFDTTVDDQGVPYDDEDLAGNEHIVGKGNTAVKDFADPNSLGGSSQETSAAAFSMNRESTGSPVPYRISRLRPRAAPFVSGVQKLKDMKAKDMSLEDRMAELKTVFGTINAARLAEQENLTSKTNFKSEARLSGRVGDTKPADVKEENSSTGEQHLPAGSQSENDLGLLLESWFDTVNAGRHSHPVVGANDNISSNVLRANTNTKPSRMSFASQYTAPELDSSPLMGSTSSSLGLYSPSGFSPVYAGRK